MFVFLVMAFATVNPPCPPTESDMTWSLVVQVVDQTWVPLPDAAIEVIPFTSKRGPSRAATNKLGFACFALTSAGDYRLKATRDGFIETLLDWLEVYPSAYGAQYVQLKMPVRSIEQETGGHSDNGGNE